MAASQNFICKVCGKIVNNNSKTILCAGKCKVLYHLQCIPLNNDEKNALSSSTKLLWLCESCSTVEPGSLFSVLSELITSVSVLNKEISVLKEIIQCSHRNMKNVKSEVDRNCSCQLSRKRNSTSLSYCEEKISENGKEDSNTLDIHPAKIKVEYVSPEKSENETSKTPDIKELLITVKDTLELTETMSDEKESPLTTQGHISSSSEPKSSCNEQDPLLSDTNLMEVSSIKNKPHKTITTGEKSSSTPKSDNDSAKNPEDTVKSSRRSIRPAYKVQVIKEGSIDELDYIVQFGL